MSDWYYNSAGLKVSTEIELPEWSALQHTAPFTVPDVVIQSLPSITPFSGESQQAVSEGEYRFSVPNVGNYQVVGGTRIVVTHLPDVDQRKLRLFLLGSAWGGLCYQRGMLAVHAGAVRVGDEAVLICAPQKRGKSTMTACLAARGHALISDDLCCVALSEGTQAIVYPSTQRFRLWGDAIDALGWNREDLEKDYFRMDKYVVPWHGGTVASPLRLRSIYLLEWGNECRLTKLTGRGALQRFIAAATHRAEVLDRMDSLGSHWQRCLELVENVPVWELSRPNDLKKMERVVSVLEQHWNL